MEIGVYLEGNQQAPGAESTFTENVSERGARVVSSRRWELNDRLTFTARSGEFRSMARVAYCQAMQGSGFAVGLEFLEPRGRWVVQNAR
jgi:PilZ domain-containing protein